MSWLAARPARRPAKMGPSSRATRPAQLATTVLPSAARSDEVRTEGQKEAQQCQAGPVRRRLRTRPRRRAGRRPRRLGTPTQFVPVTGPQRARSGRARPSRSYPVTVADNERAAQGRDAAAPRGACTGRGRACAAAPPQPAVAAPPAARVAPAPTRGAADPTAAAGGGSLTLRAPPWCLRRARGRAARRRLPASRRRRRADGSLTPARLPADRMPLAADKIRASAEAIAYAPSSMGGRASPAPSDFSCRYSTCWIRGSSSMREDAVAARRPVADGALSIGGACGGPWQRPRTSVAPAATGSRTLLASGGPTRGSAFEETGDCRSLSRRLGTKSVLQGRLTNRRRLRVMTRRGRAGIGGSARWAVRRRRVLWRAAAAARRVELAGATRLLHDGLPGDGLSAACGVACAAHRARSWQRFLRGESADGHWWQCGSGLCDAWAPGPSVSIVRRGARRRLSGGVWWCAGSGPTASTACRCDDIRCGGGFVRGAQAAGDSTSATSAADLGGGAGGRLCRAPDKAFAPNLTNDEIHVGLRLPRSSAVARAQADAAPAEHRKRGEGRPIIHLALWRRSGPPASQRYADQ